LVCFKNELRRELEKGRGHVSTTDRSRLQLNNQVRQKYAVGRC
jgi:hypothetical protein